MRLTETTASPASSTASSRSESGPVTRTRTRSRVAPGRPSRAPAQLNGMACRPSPPLSRAAPHWSAASNSAGWMPNPRAGPASSGSVTSAYTSSPSRHAARRPENAGP